MEIGNSVTVYTTAWEAQGEVIAKSLHAVCVRYERPVPQPHSEGDWFDRETLLRAKDLSTDRLATRIKPTCPSSS